MTGSLLLFPKYRFNNPSIFIAVQIAKPFCCKGTLSYRHPNIKSHQMLLQNRKNAGPFQGWLYLIIHKRDGRKRLSEEVLGGLKILIFCRGGLQTRRNKGETRGRRNEGRRNAIVLCGKYSSTCRRVHRGMPHDISASWEEL